MTIPSEEGLLKAAAHIGHRVEKWNPKMKPFIYGEQKGIHIFDLTKTREQLQRTCEELAALHREAKTILFVSTKLHSTQFLEELGKALGHPVVTRKWIPGLLTNYRTISRRIKYYLDLQQSFRTGEVEKYTKKEQRQLRKKLTKLDNALAGVSGMTGLPQAVIVVDALRDGVAVREAHTLGIRVYGICDSNADPDFFTVPIPANDDSVHAVKLILETIKQALLGAGKAEKKGSDGSKGSEVGEVSSSVAVQ
jgi:small subunit ribosomal protein S2